MTISAPPPDQILAVHESFAGLQNRLTTLFNNFTLSAIVQTVDDKLVFKQLRITTDEINLPLDGLLDLAKSLGPYSSARLIFHPEGDPGELPVTDDDLSRFKLTYQAKGSDDDAWPQRPALTLLFENPTWPWNR
jgi:hypothetical protein